MLRKPLVHKNKKAARTLLYLSPVVLFALVWGVTAIASRLGRDMGWKKIDFSRYESVALLREYLQIDTSYPDGNEIPAAEFLARHLEAAGIPAHVERLGVRNANLWAVVEGDERQALVLHSHLDIEAVDHPELWRHPPFGGVLEPPFIYGRGAFDMKSYTIAQLMAMLEVKRRGATPHRSLMLLATGEEEIDSRVGAVWMLRQHPEVMGRSWAILTEGGAVEAISLDEAKYWGTEFGQKRFVDVWVCDARRERLEGLRRELLAVEPRLRPPSPVVARFFKEYAPSRDNPVVQHLLSHPETLPDDPRTDALPLYVKAMLRNEVVPFPVEEDPEGGFHMRVILHLLPEADFAEAWEELLPGGLFGFDYVTDVPHEPSLPSPLDHPVFQQIDAWFREELPQVHHGPLFIPWSASDSRFFRAAGVPSYGFHPFWILSSDTNKMKGPNERLAAQPFVEGVERYVAVVERLLAVPTAAP